MTAENNKAISPVQVDRLARAWEELDARETAIEAERKVLAEQILAAIEAQGELAERASKTQVVAGKEWDLRVTSGQTTSVDQKAARDFLAEVPRALGELIFRREEKFVLLETPDRLPGGADLSVRVRKLFQSTLVIKPRAPRIETRSRLAKEKSA
jgi:hypothetical protein